MDGVNFSLFHEVLVLGWSRCWDSNGARMNSLGSEPWRPVTPEPLNTALCIFCHLSVQWANRPFIWTPPASAAFLSNTVGQTFTLYPPFSLENTVHSIHLLWSPYKPRHSAHRPALIWLQTVPLSPISWGAQYMQRSTEWTQEEFMQSIPQLQSYSSEFTSNVGLSCHLQWLELVFTYLRFRLQCWLVSVVCVIIFQ